MRYWPGDPAADVAVLYVHGIQSHGGWYEWSGSVLADAGLPVLMPDRRGSGASQAPRGDAPSVARLLDDLDETAAWLLRESGARRLAAVGVSWGGKLLTAWAAERRSELSDLLLVAPGLFPVVDVGVVTKLKVALALLLRPRTTFPIPLSDSSLFTDSESGRKFIADDAQKLSRATARFLWCSRRLDWRVAAIGERAIRVRATLALGGRDRIIDNSRTERWLGGVCLTPPRVDFHPNAAHTLEFEDDVRAYERGLRRWAGQVRQNAATPGA